MATVSNDPKQMSARILVREQEAFEKLGITPEFLDYCVKPAFGAGVRRRRFWLIKTDSIIRSNKQPDQAYLNFYNVLLHSRQLGFSMIQIVSKKDATPENFEQ